MASLNPDTMKLFDAILSNKDGFSEAHKSLPAIATKLAVDEMKSRPTDFNLLRTLRTALGDRDFALLLDAVSKPNLTKAVKSIDKDNPELRGAEVKWLRARLRALVDGEPAFVKPLRAPNLTRTRKATPRVASTKRETNPTKAKNSKAVWDGKNRDDEP